MKLLIVIAVLLATPALAENISNPPCALGDRMWSCEPNGSNPPKKATDNKIVRERDQIERLKDRYVPSDAMPR